MKDFDFKLPTRLIFGAGKVDALASLPLPGRCAMIVITGGKSMRANGYLERVERNLRQNGCRTVVFDKVLPNPIRAHVMEGAALAVREGCDFIVGLGGGSSIDSAKAIAIMAVNPGDYWDYVSGGTGGGEPFVRDPLPVVAIPTTAGTGTEADPWTVITHEERNEKIGFGNDKTFPAISIVDPELMLTVPPRLTAFQGFDALFHAMEGAMANIATPLSDSFAYRSIELIAGNLAAAVKCGSDLEARGAVAAASTLAGLVEATSCCISQHSLAHAIGALHPNIPHGAALTAISLEYFRHFEDKCPDVYRRIARALGSATVPEGLEELQRACGADRIALSEYGVTCEEIPAIVDNAFATMGGLFLLDPVKLEREEAVGILRRSWR